MDTTHRPLALIVDDDYAFAEYLRMVLEPAGWRTVVCQEPLKAQELAARERPDLIMLDLIMPDMGGLEVLLWLKERPETKTVPVIVCSVNMDRKVAMEVAALGGVESLVKPLSKNDLLSCLRRVVPAAQPA